MLTSQHNMSTATSILSIKPTDNNCSNFEDSTNIRNCSTPVVSALALDQQQEKDFLSIQGGRRRKPLTPTPAHTVSFPSRVYPSNGYINPFVGAIPYHPPPSQPFNTYNSYPSQNRTSYNVGYQRRPNGFDHRTNNKLEKRNFDGSKGVYSNEHSSRSSLRTDSNSSASCVDENKNEDKSHTRTTVNTPPPAPYSPLANPFKLFTLPNYPKTTNSRNPTNSKFTNNRAVNHNNYYFNEKCRSNNVHSNSSKTGTVVSNYGTSKTLFTSNSQQNSTSQVHVNSQGLVSSPSSQGFSSIPSNARRSRRSIRRSGTSGGINEIGAGDAPLPNDVGGDICKKLDTMKL